MKKILINMVFGIMFLTGFGILTYPTVSDQWNTYRQSRLISDYENVVAEMEPEDYSREWESARSFNDTFTSNNLYGDVFGEDTGELQETEYWQILNVAGDGVMGYMSIPKINIRLAIYHGTGDAVLQTGIGHLNGTWMRRWPMKWIRSFPWWIKMTWIRWERRCRWRRERIILHSSPVLLTE